MKKLLIFLTIALLIMMTGCTVPEVPEEVEVEDVAITIESFVQEVNCGGTIYRVTARGPASVCNPNSANYDCQDCAEFSGCAPCCPPELTCDDLDCCAGLIDPSDCDECDECVECEECPEIPECEECPDPDPCCSYFALGDLYIQLVLEGIGTVDDVTFDISFTDGTSMVQTITIDAEVDGTSEVEVLVILPQPALRVNFVELL